MLKPAGIFTNDFSLASISMEVANAPVLSVMFFKKDLLLLDISLIVYFDYVEVNEN